MLILSQGAAVIGRQLWRIDVIKNSKIAAVKLEQAALGGGP